MAQYPCINKCIARFKHAVVNLAEEQILSPSNFFRVAGMLTRKALVGPLKVPVDITDACDTQCVMCWYHSPLIKKKVGENFFMSLGRFKNLVRELRTIKTRVIMLCGEGEPLIHPHVEEMVEAARQESLEVEIMTNAVSLNRRKAESFSKMGVKKIIVSLHAADFGTFNKIRPHMTGEDFKQTVENLRYMKNIPSGSRRMRLFIVNVISRLNYLNIDAMAVLAENIGADKVLFKPLVLFNLPESLQLSIEECKGVIDNARKLASTLHIPNNLSDYARSLQCRISEESRQRYSPYGCSALYSCYIPWVQSVISINGDVLGCVYARKYLLGNIYNSTFSDIWFGKKYIFFRQGSFCPAQCLGRAVYPLLT
ncbi:MAG: radical SAM protein [Candidatus Omnitrophota bacterium]